MSFIGKEYNFTKQENFEAFMRFVGTPEDRIDAVSKFTAPVKFVKNGDSYTLYTKNHLGDIETTFKSGVEFDDFIGAEKVPVKSLFVVDVNTVTQTVKTDNQVVVLKREYNGDELVVTYSANGFDGVAKRFYKA